MAKITDAELIERLLAATQQEKIDWKPTARRSEFTATFGGKWTLLTDEYTAENDEWATDLILKDSEGNLLLRITDRQDRRIGELHELARRHALKVNDAMADLLSELDKPQA